MARNFLRTTYTHCSTLLQILRNMEVLINVEPFTSKTTCSNSGKNPIAQIVKRLNESAFVPQKINTSDTEISTKHPNNVYIMQNDACCELISKNEKKNENGHDVYVCRVYNKSESLFIHPCDSRVIGVFKVYEKNAKMQMVSAKYLHRRAIKIHCEETRAIIFMAILHEF